MLNAKEILLLIVILLYITFIIMIFVGGGFITKVLYNSSDIHLYNVGIQNKTDLNIAKMTIVLFWMVFIPLCILPLIFIIGYGKYIFKYLK
jgi:hypothetical protein